MGDLEQRNLINELMQGKELAKQLLFHLNTPSSSREVRELLLQRILASYEKALSILHCNTMVAVEPPIRTVESPPSPRSGSPRSEDSDRDVKDQENKDSTPKKRKTLPKWTQRVRLTPGSPLEVRLDDGFSWRKYGQKDILGARYPRGYYRCTHRNVQGCLATKHVQRSDEEPMIFEVTYRGRHTCTQAASSSQVPPTTSSSDDTSQTLYQQTNQQQQVQTLQDNLLVNYQKSLRVVTENLDIVPYQQQPYTFPSTSFVNPETAVFSSPVSMMGSFSPQFFSPAASSGASYFPVSTTATPSGVQGNMNFRSSASAAASATNSPTVGLGFPFGDVGFGDPNFTFDDPGFFS